MASEICVVITVALFAISTIPFADAENKCVKAINKKYLGGNFKTFFNLDIYMMILQYTDCKASGESVPDVCKGIEAMYMKRYCVQVECAKECQTLGGDEVMFYDNGWTDDLESTNFICCQSTTPEQEERVQKKLASVNCRGCSLVSVLLAAPSP
jgi:hypothetical protein